MKRNLFFILIWLMALSVTVVFADDTLPDTGTGKPSQPVTVNAYEAPDNSDKTPNLITTPGLLTTNFEAVDGFSPGYCAGHNGWTAFTTSSNEGHIDAANPAAGTQNLRIDRDTNALRGANTGCFSPDSGPMPEENSYRVEVDVAISANGGADYNVVAQSPNQGFITARVRFDWLGNIFVLDNLGTGLVEVNTGVPYIVGPYRTLRLDIDSTANTIDYYYGGNLIYSGVVFAGTTVEQIVLFSDNWHNGDIGDFDNLRVINQSPTAINLVDQSVNQPISIFLVSSVVLLALLTLVTLSIRK